MMHKKVYNVECGKTCWKSFKKSNTLNVKELEDNQEQSSNAGRRVVNANQLALMPVNKMSSQNVKNWNITPSKFTFLCLKELRRASLPCELIGKLQTVSVCWFLFQINHFTEWDVKIIQLLLFFSSAHPLHIKLLHLTELEGASMSVARNHLSPAHCASLKSALQAVKSAFLFFCFACLQLFISTLLAWPSHVFEFFAPINPTSSSAPRMFSAPQRR